MGSRDRMRRCRMVGNGIVEPIQLDTGLARCLDIAGNVFELVRGARQLQHGNSAQREPGGSSLRLRKLSGFFLDHEFPAVPGTYG